MISYPTTASATGSGRSVTRQRLRESRKTSAGSPSHISRTGITGRPAPSRCVLFPDDELQILPYNRVVKDLKGLSCEDFLLEADACFALRDLGDEPAVPEYKAEIGLYMDHHWYRMEARDGVFQMDPVADLDVSILQDCLLGPVLGIEDPRTSDRISFIGGIRGTEELVRLVDSGAAAAAFAMYPTQMSELLAVADAGLLMPPKSTWFEPKLRSGIFIHLI